MSVDDDPPAKRPKVLKDRHKLFAGLFKSGKIQQLQALCKAHGVVYTNKKDSLAALVGLDFDVEAELALLDLPPPAPKSDPQPKKKIRKGVNNISDLFFKSGDLLIWLSGNQNPPTPNKNPPAPITTPPTTPPTPKKTLTTPPPIIVVSSPPKQPISRPQKSVSSSPPVPPSVIAKGKHKPYNPLQDGPEEGKTCTCQTRRRCARHRNTCQCGQKFPKRIGFKAHLLEEKHKIKQVCSLPVVLLTDFKESESETKLKVRQYLEESGKTLETLHYPVAIDPDTGIIYESAERLLEEVITIDATMRSVIQTCWFGSHNLSDAVEEKEVHCTCTKGNCSSCTCHTHGEGCDATCTCNPSTCKRRGPPEFSDWTSTPLAPKSVPKHACSGPRNLSPEATTNPAKCFEEVTFLSDF